MEKKAKKGKWELNHATDYDELHDEVTRTDLFDCLESPSERDETEEGVEVQAELCERTSGAGQHRDETVHACYLVEKLTQC